MSWRARTVLRCLADRINVTAAALFRDIERHVEDVLDGARPFSLNEELLRRVVRDAWDLHVTRSSMRTVLKRMRASGKIRLTGNDVIGYTAEALKPRGLYGVLAALESDVFANKEKE